MLKVNSGVRQQSTAQIINFVPIMIGELVRFPSGRKAVYKGCERVGTATEEFEFEFISGGMICISRQNLWIAARD